MLRRSPLWPARRWLAGTVLIVALAGIAIGCILIAIPGASQAAPYVILTEAAPIGAYGTAWLIGGLLVIFLLVTGQRSLPGVLLVYGAGQLGWSVVFVDSAIRNNGLGAVGAVLTAALAMVTWLAAPAVASVA